MNSLQEEQIFKATQKLFDRALRLIKGKINQEVLWFNCRHRMINKYLD